MYIFGGDVMDATHRSMCSRSILRAFLYVDFFLFALFVVPIIHHWVDQVFLALRTINLEEAGGRSMQVWIVASTIVATALFGRMVWNNRRATLPVRSLRFEGILLLAWWLTLLGACAYGFMLGLGG
jgi:hypothetical protein